MTMATRDSSLAIRQFLMSHTPITREIEIKNTQGLHARPAEMFVRLARKFEAKVELIKEDRRVDATSIIDLLTLGAAQGTKLVLLAEGSDAQAAIEALAHLVESGFPSEDAKAE
jgi:phosphotransferase system HPr (HPr) family protein